MFSFGIYSLFPLLSCFFLSRLLGFRTSRSTWLFCEKCLKMLNITAPIDFQRLKSKDLSRAQYYHCRENRKLLVCKNIHICSLKGMMILVVDIFTTSTSFLRFSTEIKSNTEALGSGYNTMRRQIIPPQAILR
jgi:hypothetical protein